MTKVTFDQPVVSPELGKVFQEIKDGDYGTANTVTDSYNYPDTGIPEVDSLGCCEFEKLLAMMYVLGYSIDEKKGNKHD